MPASLAACTSYHSAWCLPYDSCVCFAQVRSKPGFPTSRRLVKHEHTGQADAGRQVRGPIFVCQPQAPCECCYYQGMSSSLSGAALPVSGQDSSACCSVRECSCLSAAEATLSLQVKLDLADELQGTLPPGLRPYVEHVCVRATTNKQLRALGDRLSGVPSAAALELKLSFGKSEEFYLDSVKAFFRRAGLIERVRAVKYCCQSVHGADLFPGRETPVFAEVWPDHTSCQPAAFWRSLLHHSLVELQITVREPDDALLSLSFALTRGDRICGTLRCLQVDCIHEWPPLPMSVFTKFLAGLELPRLVHLGTNVGVARPFQSIWKWPQQESVPMLQSFGGTRKPDGIFGLSRSGVHMPLEDEEIADALGVATTDLSLMDVKIFLTDMAAMADSALGPAIRELHVSVKDFEATWEGIPAALPFRSVLGFLTLLKSVQQLSLIGWERTQLLVRAEAINALDGLQKLALGRVTIEGDLTGPCLTQIVCLSLQTQLRTALARPPPALASILVPHELNAVVPQAVLGI